MKNSLFIVIICLLVSTNLLAQDESAAGKKEKDTPVGNAFENGTLIDAQTSFIPDVKTFEFIIQHKFGPIENGTSTFDLFGIYAPFANVRLGFNYVPFKHLQLGVGLTKTNMNYDLNAKWTIFEQTQNNAVPVFVTVYGNVAIDGRSGDVLDQLNFKTNDRLSYFAQLITGRKFSDAISLQAGASYSHANLVARYLDHGRIGLHFSARAKFRPQASFILTYDAPLKNGPYRPEPSLKYGVEITTFTHTFQIYIGNARSILPQYDMLTNMNKPFKDLSFGFTITRLWFSSGKPRRQRIAP